MRVVIQIGKPIHFQPFQHTQSACGLIGTGHMMAYDPRDVECLNCRKTRLWKERMYGKHYDTNTN